MMDVGSRGGYFDEKSPKLLLHEWCMRNKRPKPRYVTQSGGGGRGGGAGQFGCKVVLPDPKGVADRDVVVFLDASLMADDAEEAAQRGAVAALHAVQGDRALDYVLPARYRMVWRELGDKVRGRGGGLRGAGRGCLGGGRACVVECSGWLGFCASRLRGCGVRQALEAVGARYKIHRGETFRPRCNGGGRCMVCWLLCRTQSPHSSPSQSIHGAIPCKVT